MQKQAPQPDSVDEKILLITKQEKPKNVNQLVGLLKERLNFTEDQALNKILELQDLGKIKFETNPPQTPSNLSSYLKTNQTFWYWITITLAALTLFVVLLIPEDLAPWSLIRNILGAVFVLWLPGYALIKTLFPVQVPIKTATESLDIVERIVLSLGMSIAIVPLVGLFLNYTPWGVQLTPIVLSLFVFTLVFATIAVIREHQSKMKPKEP
jgi:Protein of unknown function (DUF1616)